MSESSTVDLKESHDDIGRDAAQPRYDLTAEELRELESALVAEVKEIYTEEGVVAVWIKPNNPYANVMRNYEAVYFPEVRDLAEDVEESTLFLALVDTRTGSDRVVHGATITGVDGFKEVAKSEDGEETGFAVIDEITRLNDFTAQELVDYYRERGIDLSTCVAVETNFWVGDEAPKFNGLGTSDLAYMTLFKRQAHLAGNTTHASLVFASINDKSIDSFKQRQLPYELLMGRDDLMTPEEALKGERYVPITINIGDIKFLFDLLEELPTISM